VAALVVAGLLVTGFLVIMAKREKKRERRVKEAEQKRTRRELRRLRTELANKLELDPEFQHAVEEHRRMKRTRTSSA
jgi:hypothetical protein